MQDRKATLQNARKQREERQRARREHQAATVIGSYARKFVVAKAMRALVRQAWTERNGQYGEGLSSIDKTNLDLKFALLSVRQVVFFAENTSDDALRICSVCDMARRSLSEVWLEGEECTREGKLPALCHLLISRCVALLTRLGSWEGSRGGSGVSPSGVLTRATETVLPFLDIYLDLRNRLGGGGVRSAIAKTLAALVARDGLFHCVAALLRLSGAGGSQEFKEFRQMHFVEAHAILLLSRCLDNKITHRDLLDLLVVPEAFQGEGTDEVREPLWEAMMKSVATTTRAEVQAVLEKHREPEKRVTMLQNFIVLSRNQRNQTDFLAPFLELLDLLLSNALRALKVAPNSDVDAMEVDSAAKSDLASSKSNEIVSILTENVDMWNGLSVSILPSGPNESMSQNKLDGTIALVSLLSKLITHCGDAQPLVVMLTSMAFKVQFLEKLWFFVSSLDIESIDEGDQATIRDAVIVMCTVHVLRLQIINDKEYYQQNSLMNVSELNSIVVHVKNFLARQMETLQITLEDLEGDHLPWQDKMVFQKAVDLLDKLHEQNGRYHLIEDASFHLKITLDEAFLKEAETGGRAKLICSYCPYFIPFHDRVKIFRHFLERDRRDYYSNLPQEVRMNPFLSAKTVVIRRKYILEDGYSRLDHLGQALKCIVRIQFINELGEEEPGVDGGGLFKDFLESLITTAFDTQYGFFKSNPENKLYPNPSSSSVTDQHLDFFRFFGRMIGKAIYEGILVDVPFAEFFLRKIRGKKNGFDDLQSLDKELYTNLCFLRGYEGSIEDLGLYFAVEQDNFGRVVVEDLIPGGKDVVVSSASVIKYIHLMANFKLNLQLKRQVMAFMQGLQDLIDREWIALFNDSELQELISGSEKGFDLDDMRRNMHYSGGYNESHPVIKMFWGVVSEFTIEERQKLLKFVTACSRPPLLGFSFLEPAICIQMASGQSDKEGRLPTAATCMNLLKLPPYADKDSMEEKIRYAINSNAGFDLS